MPAEKLEDFALVVGINKYADQGFLTPLDGPKNDVHHFVEWLKSPKGGKVPDKNLIPYLLESNDLGTTPNSSDFCQAVAELLKKSQGGDVRIGRRLYIFLAGHGVGPDLDDAGLLTAEATEIMPAYVEGRRYANLFRGSAVFKEVILIMDCCRDIDDELPAPSFPFKRKIDPGGAYKVKRFYAYATGFGKAAREKAFGKEVNGIFSHVLIDGLNGGAIDGEGRITGRSLEQYVRKHLKKLLPPETEQDPDIRCDQDLVFADGFKAATVDVSIETTVAHSSLSVLYGNGFKPVESVPVVIGDGKYKIQLRIGKTYVFQLLDVNGVIIKQDGRAIEDVDGVINVKL